MTEVIRNSGNILKICTDVRDNQGSFDSSSLKSQKDVLVMNDTTSSYRDWSRV